MSARRTTENVVPLPTGLPPCEHCGGRGVEVWPCSFCRQSLHVECGYGVEYHEAVWPPQEIDGQPVIGAWLCTGCDTVAGLDVAESGGEQS